MKCCVRLIMVWLIMTGIYLIGLYVSNSAFSESILLGVLYLVATCALTEVM